jgi:hypothetical protein
MKPFIFSMLLVLLFSVPAISQDHSKLLPIKKIYVGELGTDKRSPIKMQSVQEQIRQRLLKADRFDVVDSSEAADAVLTGIAWAPRETFNRVNMNPLARSVYDTDPVYFGKGIVHLVDPKSNEPLWDYEYSFGFNYRMLPSKIARKVVGKLIDDAKEASKAAVKNKAKP